MINKEKHNAKKLIRNIDLDSPSDNFTKKVMDEVNILSEDLILKDEVLTSLLKKTSLESPKPDFSSIVLKKVSINVNTAYKPIIDKRSWYVIFFIFGASTIYQFFAQPNLTNTNSYFSKFSKFFNKLIPDLDYSISHSIQVPSVLIVSVLCLSILLYLDTIFRSKKIF